MPAGGGYTLAKRMRRSDYDFSSTRQKVEFAKAAGRIARKMFDKYRRSSAKKAVKEELRSGRTRAYRPTVGRKYQLSPYTHARNTPAVEKMGWSTGQSLNRVKKPKKGSFSAKGTVVVNRASGRQGKKQRRRFRESTYTTAFIGSNPRLDSAGNMGKLDQRYTYQSVDSEHDTGWIYNVGGTSNYWNPAEKGKIGNQVIGTTDTQNNFYLINAANSDLENIDYVIKQNRLPETSTPFNTGELPVQHVYRTPNTILASVDLNLSFTPASVQDNLITVQVVRATAPIPIVPGDLGHTETESPFSTDRAKFMLTNSTTRCNGHYLQILYSKSFLLKGINLNAKQPKSVYVKKKVKMNYLRSTVRRESSAAIDDLDYKLGGEWKAQFAIDETGAQFNNVYVKVLAKCVTKTAKANMTVGDAGGALGTVSKSYVVPTFHNMDSSTSPFEYTDMKNARFRYGGSIGVQHYCQEISRGFGNSEMTTLASLQNQINQLQDLAAQAQLDDCTSCDESDHASDHESDEDCGSGHQAGASPPGDGHTHPNDLTAEEHDANCQHSH